MTGDVYVESPSTKLQKQRLTKLALFALPDAHRPAATSVTTISDDGAPIVSTSAQSNIPAATGGPFPWAKLAFGGALVLIAGGGIAWASRK